MNKIIIGDVHGCINQVNELLHLIGPGSDDEIISVGDFVDRGPDGPACVDFFKKHKAIMGNHEYKHVRYRHGVLKRLSKSQAATKHQYEIMGIDYETAVDYMESLPFYLDLPEAIIVHAGLEYGIPLEKQHPIVLVGGMSKRHITGINPQTQSPYWCANYPEDAKPVIFGHLSLLGRIPIRNNLFPIDTGCCHGNKLTAVVLPSFRIYQVAGYQRRQ